MVIQMDQENKGGQMVMYIKVIIINLNIIGNYKDNKRDGLGE